MTNDRWKHRHRAWLLRTDPHCWYCGVTLTWAENAAHPLPPDFATLEHLFAKTTRRRQRRTGRLKPFVILAYLACNHARGQWSVALATAPARERWAAWRAEHGYPEPRRQGG